MYYCKKCKKEHKEHSNIGKKHKKYSKETKKLYRSRKNKKIAGVCGGLGEYLEVDPTIIRIVWVIFILLSFGTAILAYLLAWLIIPKEPKD